MKFKFLLAVLLGGLVFSQALSAYQQSEVFTSGEEWRTRMSRKEKFLAIYVPLIIFHRYGVNFQKTPEQYISTIDNVLLQNPYLEKEDVANIFASTVYFYEPENRPAIQAIARDSQYQRLRVKESYSPSVVLSPRSEDSFDI